MTETEERLAKLLISKTKDEKVIKGTVLFLRKEEQQLEMINYLTENENNNITIDQIMNKTVKLLKE